MAAPLLLVACNGADGIEPSSTPSPTPVETGSPTPDAQSLDDQTAAQLYVTWRKTVYALPPTRPRAVDVDSAGDGIAVPGSEASDWIRQELELALERGVIVRGDVDAEPLSRVTTTGEAATVPICSSAQVRITDVATGDPVGDEKADESYTRFDVTYRRVEQEWLVERAESEDENDCVPPSIEEAVAARWDVFTEAWYERDRQGGGEELGRLTEVVTDRFAQTLRGLAPREPVTDPAEFTNFELVSATRRSVTAQACRSGGLETIEWKLVKGQWRVDFAGQVGQETKPCA
ncbi:MAG TPA: hypothetical protein VM344_00635 [Vitreimonas sp.]|nr:hypothetical protein [Vitreimonas sp.]